MLRIAILFVNFIKNIKQFIKYNLERRTIKKVDICIAILFTKILIH